MESVITIADFEDARIDPDRFDHEAHVYLGWLYVSEFPLAEAIGRFDAGLRRLVRHLGAEGKYHATLTWFFLLLIAERARDGEPWEAFKQRNADLVTDSKAVLARYYSEQRLSSSHARERFVLPDRLAMSPLANAN
jgi:hypothetical protein